MIDRSSLRSVMMRGIVDVGVFSSLINVLLLVTPIYLPQIYVGYLGRARCLDGVTG